MHVSCHQKDKNHHAFSRPWGIFSSVRQNYWNNSFLSSALCPPVHSSSSSWPLELCSPAWCLAPVAPPASTWWSFGPARWPWKAAQWPLTNAKVRCTSSRRTTPSSTSAGRTAPPGMWMMWVNNTVGMWVCCPLDDRHWAFLMCNFSRIWSSSPMTASSNVWTSAPRDGCLCWSLKLAPKGFFSGCRCVKYLQLIFFLMIIWLVS